MVWVDAHTDINTEKTTPSGNVHGMPLAAALGLCGAELSAVGSVLLVGLGLNLAGATKVRVMNMVPAIFIAIALAQVMH